MSLPVPTMVFTPFDPLPASDLNDIVENVEALAAGTGLNDASVTAEKTAFGGDYSTSEVNTGFKWIDGKTIYKKTINFGALPNSTNKNVAHGISSLGYVIDYSMMMVNSSNSHQPVPRTNTASTSAQSTIAIDNTSILVTTADNLSSYSAYATLLYTKT